MATNQGFGGIAVDGYVESTPDGRDPRRWRGPIATDEHASWQRTAYIDEHDDDQRSWPRRARTLLLVLLLLGLAAIATWLLLGRIEDQIETGAVQILDDAGINTDSLTFDASFRDIRVDGTIPTGVEAAEIGRLLENERAANGADIRTATVAAIKQRSEIDVRIESDGQTVTLSGTVPLEAHRQVLLESAAQSGAVIDDQLIVAGEDPSAPDISARLDDLTTLLPRLGEETNTARIVMTDDAFLGEIETVSPATADALRGETASTVELSSLGQLSSQVTFDGTIVVLDGQVLSEVQGNQLAISAAAAVGADRVINNLSVLGTDEAVSGSDDKVAAVATLLTELDLFNSADIMFDDTTMTISGEVIDPDAVDAVESAIAAASVDSVVVSTNLSPGFEFTLQEEIDLLQAELDALQDEISETVRFDSDSTGLSPEAGATLDKVSAAMTRYSRPVVEIGGHTDSQGEPEVNRRLSERRAASVRDHLVEAGITAERLTAVGYGESQPRAENLLEEGRQQNRRVEFSARESF